MVDIDRFIEALTRARDELDKAIAEAVAQKQRHGQLLYDAKIKDIIDWAIKRDINSATAQLVNGRRYHEE